MEPPKQYYKKDSSMDHPLKRINCCKFFLASGQCDKDKCKHRHLNYSQLRKNVKHIHNVYKKHLCKRYTEGQDCIDKMYCLFAHGEDDVWGAKIDQQPYKDVDFQQNGQQIQKKQKKKDENPKTKEKLQNFPQDQDQEKVKEKEKKKKKKLQKLDKQNEEQKELEEFYDNKELLFDGLDQNEDSDQYVDVSDSESEEEIPQKIKNNKSEKVQQKNISPEKVQKVQNIQKQQNHKNNDEKVPKVPNKLELQINMTVYAIFFYKNENHQNQWKKCLNEIFTSQQISTTLIQMEEIKESNVKNFTIKIITLKENAIKLLRLHLIKDEEKNLMFKLMPSTEIQIVFNSTIKIKQILNQISFISEDNEICYVFNSRIVRREDHETEYKMFDLRKFNENTRTLEQTITGMLNRDDLIGKQSNDAYCGHIILGVKDDTRVLEGNYAPNQTSEQFFTFLQRRLKDTQPSCQGQVDRNEYRVVIPNEDDSLYYPILDCKVHILSIKYPRKREIYQSSNGLYFQRIEEGVWPMASAQLFESYKKGLISEANLTQGLKSYDRRYFYIITQKAERRIEEEDDYS